MTGTLRRALASACVLTLLVTACGDDDDVAGGDDSESATGDLAAYCDMVTELDTQDGPPTAEQMTEIKEIRPDEIGEEIDAVADAFIAADGDVGSVFADPEIEANFEVIDAFESENCPGQDEDVDGEDESAGEVNPEFADYCAFSATIDEGDGPPDAAQIRELLELAPEEISEAAGVVAAELDANGDDVEAIFSNPEVGAAIGEIEAFDSENCGTGGEEGEDGDLEAADDATVVPVVGVDFAYEGVPAEIAAGPVAFEFTNEGEAIHEAVLFPLEGRTADEVIADAEAAFEADEDDIGDIGFAFAPPGGDARYINADLEAGDYVLICFIPGPEGKPHYDLGMQQTFSVG